MKYIILLFTFLLACSKSSQPTTLKIDYTTQDGVKLISGGFKVDKLEFQQEVRYVAGIWQQALDKEKISCKALPSLKGITVQYKEYPFISSATKNKVYGETYPGKKLLLVGWHKDIKYSALGHEIGHYILYACKQDYMEDNLLKWAKKYKLPY